jgi:hypothetical protein
MQGKVSELQHVGPSNYPSARPEYGPSPSETLESCVNDLPWIYMRDVARNRDPDLDCPPSLDCSVT